MSEINTLPKHTRAYQRPPLMVPDPGGASLHMGASLRERLDLPFYGVTPVPDPQAQEAQPVSLQHTAPTLQQFLTDNPELPPQTAILGICEDQLPVLLDLNDPSPGSVLIIGDERQQQIELLRMAASSVIWRNAPHGIQFLVISHAPDAWQTWVNEQDMARYCLGVLGVEDPQLGEWMHRLGEWSEQRRLGQRQGPPVLILLDTLSFLNKSSYDLRLNLEWLIKDGPIAQFWPIAAISTALAKSLAQKVAIFQTLILGYSADSSFYVKMADQSEAAASSFGQPGQFAVKVASPEGDIWLKFWLPQKIGSG